MLSPRITLQLVMSAATVPIENSERRQKAMLCLVRSVATSSNLCGCLGTITVSRFGISLEAMASKIRASSPSRVLAAKNTGRLKPSKLRKYLPRSASSAGGLTSNLRLPATTTLPALPSKVFKRVASCSVCAAIALKLFKPCVVSVLTLA